MGRKTLIQSVVRLNSINHSINFENRSVFDKVRGKNIVAPFFRTGCSSSSSSRSSKSSSSSK